MMLAYLIKHSIIFDTQLIYFIELTKQKKRIAEVNTKNRSLLAAPQLHCVFMQINVGLNEFMSFVFRSSSAIADESEKDFSSISNS